MKQLTYVKKNTLQWWDVEEPRMKGATDAIVRPLAAARCDGDKAFLFYDITPVLMAGLALHYIDPITKIFLVKNHLKLHSRSGMSALQKSFRVVMM